MGEQRSLAGSFCLLLVFCECGARQSCTRVSSAVAVCVASLSVLPATQRCVQLLLRALQLRRVRGLVRTNSGRYVRQTEQQARLSCVQLCAWFLVDARALFTLYCCHWHFGWKDCSFDYFRPNCGGGSCVDVDALYTFTVFICRTFTWFFGPRDCSPQQKDESAGGHLFWEQINRRKRRNERRENRVLDKATQGQLRSQKTRL
jgi:hypothetical protein